MKTKLYSLFVFSCLLFSSSLFAQEAGYILYVTDNVVDSGFIQLLQAQDYDVQVKGTSYSKLLDQASLDSVNGAALCILSRNCATSDFDPSANAGVADQWNGEVTVPLISLSPWLIRSNRLQWFNSTVVNCNNDTITVTFDGTGDLIFEGIKTDAPVPFYKNADGTQGSDWIDVTANGAGNATVLATDAGGVNIAIARFDGGLDNFYEGTTQHPANDRIWFSAGKSDCGGASEPDALYNLNETGEAAFLNLIAIYVLNPSNIIRSNYADAVKLSVFPNPAQTNLNISLRADYAGTALVSIVDVVGKLVYQTTTDLNRGKNNLKLDVSDFASGMYTVNVNFNDAQIVQKIMIK